MEAGELIQVPVVCAICRREYRQAQIVPITAMPASIAGICDRCENSPRATDADEQSSRASRGIRPAPWGGGRQTRTALVRAERSLGYAGFVTSSWVRRRRSIGTRAASAREPTKHF